MNKPDLKENLKALIKPLLKEVVKECLLESGVLSNLISEVVRGLQGSLIVESRVSPSISNQKLRKTEREMPSGVVDPEMEALRAQAKEELAEERKSIQEKRQRMMESTGMSHMFKGLEPMREEIQQPVLSQPVSEQTISQEAEELLSPEEKKQLLEEKLQAKKKTREQKLQESEYDPSGRMSNSLRDIDPSNPGVNIKGIMNLIGGKSEWIKRLK